jgi:uncharacterized protein (DUF1697 family)
MTQPTTTDGGTWIALLRGINVGGARRLEMRDLVALAEGLGWRDVEAYVQSGNLVFRSPVVDPKRLGQQLEMAVTEGHGFTPRALVLSRDDLERAVAEMPFGREADDDPTSVHAFFLAAAPSAPDLPALEEIRAPSERYRLWQRVFYLHAPQGFGRSKLAARAEKLLGVEATARNWRTVTALLALARDRR